MIKERVWEEGREEEEEKEGAGWDLRGVSIFQGTPEVFPPLASPKSSKWLQVGGPCLSPQLAPAPHNLCRRKSSLETKPGN